MMTTDLCAEAPGERVAVPAPTCHLPPSPAQAHLLRVTTAAPSWSCTTTARPTWKWGANPGGSTAP